MAITTDVGPTEAQRDRFAYIDNPVQEGAKLKGRPCRRLPVYVTMHAQKRIPDDLMNVLGWYRDRFDASQYSPLKDSLAREMPKEGGGSYDAWRARIMDAVADVTYAEAGVSPFLRPTLRKIVLEDWTTTDIARERWRTWVPGQRRIDHVAGELRAAGYQMLAQVRHILDTK